MFGISYDAVDVLAGFAEKHGIGFPLLSDEGSRVIRALGMLNEQLDQHHAFYGVPVRDHQRGVPYPGLFLLDEHGVVTGKRFQSSYRERETAGAILERGFHVPSTHHGAEARARTEGVTVRAVLDSLTYRFYQRLWLTVEVTIDPGLHVYARPAPEGYVPLSVEAAPIAGLAVGEPDVPAGQPFHIEGLEEQYFVYEGTVALSVPVTFTVRDAGDQTLRVTVRYQACSATDCLLPAAVTLDLSVQAAALVT